MSATLNNGVGMPALGFGVFQTPPDVTAASVVEALRVGYRLIDTAASYFNEREVGEGIRRSGLDRSEVFFETKVWISDYGYDETLHAVDKSRLRAHHRPDRGHRWPQHRRPRWPGPPETMTPEAFRRDIPET